MTDTDVTNINWYLDNWARYMRGGCSPAKLPKESPSMTGLPNFIYDPEGQYELADQVAAQATDAAIADLEPIESCAIHCAYLAAVFRFHREALDVVLDRAKANVKQGLIRRGMWAPRYAGE